MKPKRNKIFCLSCRRTKMLFESQAKADNFILFNKDEIEEENGRAPVRSYYCRLCGGWHVTSNDSEKDIASFERRDEQISAEVEKFAKMNENVAPVIDEVKKRWQEVDVTIIQGQLESAESSLNYCLDILAPLRFCGGNKQEKWILWYNRINEQLRNIFKIRDLIDMPVEERESFLSKDNKTKDEEKICLAFLNYQTIFKIESLLEEVEKGIPGEDKKIMKMKLLECRRLLKQVVNCPFKKDLIKNYKLRIDDKCKRAQISLLDEPKVKEKKMVIRPNSLEYKESILYLIEKFEVLQKSYGEEDFDECESLLEIIEHGLDELPKDPKTLVLQQQYDKWYDLISEQLLNG